MLQGAIAIPAKAGIHLRDGHIIPGGIGPLHTTVYSINLRSLGDRH